MKKEDLQTLTKAWYQKIKESGFNDIEDTRSPRELLKTWHSNYFFIRYTPETFESKFQYYQRAAHFLHEYKFKKRIEKQLWKLHCEGLGYREMAKKLEITMSGCDKSVHSIITRLQSVMKHFEFEQE